MSLKETLKKFIELTPYRVTRGAPNRFQAIQVCLGHLRNLGYAPRVIVDGGAHLGSFALEASAVFPEAAIHMIDPQPACRASLEALATAHGFSFHCCALAAASGTVAMICSSVPDTGAHLGGVPASPSEISVEVKAVSLDSLFAATSVATDRILLKLDLEGHEFQALRGASRLLALVEVVLVEVSFFHQLDNATIPQLVGFLDGHGFDLFDIAALNSRARDNRLRQGDFVFVRRGSPISADTAWG